MMCQVWPLDSTRKYLNWAVRFFVYMASIDPHAEGTMVTLFVPLFTRLIVITCPVLLAAGGRVNLTTPPLLSQITNCSSASVTLAGPWRFINLGAGVAMPLINHSCNMRKWIR